MLNQRDTKRGAGVLPKSMFFGTDLLLRKYVKHVREKLQNCSLN
jgi:hypothetical protein